MKKHTYTKVLAHKGRFTQSARLYHLASKGLPFQNTEMRAKSLSEAYKLDIKLEVSA